MSGRPSLRRLRRTWSGEAAIHHGFSLAARQARRSSRLAHKVVVRSLGRTERARLHKVARGTLFLSPSATLQRFAKTFPTRTSTSHTDGGALSRQNRAHWCSLVRTERVRRYRGPAVLRALCALGVMRADLSRQARQKNGRLIASQHGRDPVARLWHSSQVGLTPWSLPL